MDSLWLAYDNVIFIIKSFHGHNFYEFCKICEILLDLQNLVDLVCECQCENSNLPECFHINFLNFVLCGVHYYDYCIISY